MYSHVQPIAVLPIAFSQRLFWVFILGLGMVSIGCQPSEFDFASTQLPVNSASFRVSVASQNASLRNEPIRPLEIPQGLCREKVQLGRELFHDARLSKDNSISCASCHVVKDGGDDGLATSIGIDNQVGPLNAPTVLNSSLFVAQFWDGRASNLQEQVAGPVHNPIEMGSDWDEVIAKLGKDRAFAKRFRRTFREGLSAETIADAIASYESALVTVNSPFDQYLRGDDSSITDDALSGYRLFKSIGCVSCHQGKAVGGNMFQEFGVMGEFNDQFEDTSEVSKGRINVTQREVDLHRFKVPSLRNVQRTAPYFHDGRTERLEDAIQIMAEFQLGESLDDNQVQQLSAFLISLNGEIPEELQ